jgi:small subunit ribosomal protein S18
MERPKTPFRKTVGKKIGRDGKPLKRTRPGSRSGFFRKKVCKLCVEKLQVIDYKDTQRLQKFITERGKITPSRLSGLCAKHQRKLATAIKRARAAALLPFTARY